MSIPILSGIENLIQSFGKPYTVTYNTPNKATPAPMYPAPDLTGDQPTPQPTQAPTQGPLQQFANTTKPTSNFQYRMGSSDYSDVAPQVQNAVKGTPMEPYANDFVQAGQKYGVDPRVLPTIANNESSLGKNYPTDTYNPFGYLVGGGGVQGLRNAGFTSLPNAIDRLTNRFAKQPTANYKQFYQQPTIENLQAAYNATPDEAAGYNQKSSDFVSKFK